MKHIWCAVLLAVALASCASAATEGSSDAPAPVMVDVWPGVAPGSESWTQTELSGQFGSGEFPNPIVRNVTHPTLTVFLPDPARATGTGVIVAPGGGFLFLSMKSEGTDVAEWFAARGVAAFVLKYRTRETPPEEAGMYRMFGALVSRSSSGEIALQMAEPARYATADAVQALSVVRAHASEWGVDPNRIGIVGFSAGARVATGLLLQSDPANRPAFAAPIYGGLFGEDIEIPANLPPVFAAVSADDPIALQSSIDLVTALRASGARPEFHMFNAGGHGYGLNQQGKTSDHWIDEFYWWLQANGLLAPSAN
jgi:acetyl esterase/lipase